MSAQTRQLAVGKAGRKRVATRYRLDQIFGQSLALVGLGRSDQARAA